MSIPEFLGSGILILMAFSAYFLTRDKIHPSVVFPLVWGVGLLFIAFLPMLGFYNIGPKALLIFISSAIFFSVVSLIAHKTFRRKTKINNSFFSLPPINFKFFVSFFILMHVLIFGYAFFEIQSFGSNILEISYYIRNKSVNGEQLFNPIISNYITFGEILIPFLFIYLLSDKLSKSAFMVLVIPWGLMILILSGRSGLIQMLLAMFFIYYFYKRKLNGSVLIYSVSFFLLIIVSGAILVAKVDVGVNQSFSEMSIVFLRHIAAYALQGPILFSQYIDSNVYVEEHWYPFRSIQHVLSLFNLVEAPESQDLNFNFYGKDKDMEGNVYSIYFSVYPWLGILGSFFTIGLYSLIVTYFYVRSGSGNLIYLLISSFLFSAIVLSMFSDLFLPSFYFILKLSIIILFIKKWFKYRFRT